MSERRKSPPRTPQQKGFIVLICIIVISSAVAVYQIVAGARTAPRVQTAPSAQQPMRVLPIKRGFRFGAAESIAVLHIEGVIEQANKSYNQQWIMDVVESLQYDDRNKGILLYIDSPGGAVYQADELYLALCAYRDSGKPVYAALGPTAASGGYYLACAAERIYANRNTLTGSIGVIFGTSVDLTGLFDQYGIKMTTITSGKNKNMMNINSPLTEEQAAIMQSIADEAYDQFTSIVAESRGMPINSVHALADGRVYTAKQAHARGLIDGVMSLDDTKQEMLRLAFDGQYYEFEDYSYEAEFAFSDLFAQARSALGLDRQAALPASIAELLSQGRLYPAYYCPMR